MRENENVKLATLGLQLLKFSVYNPVGEVADISRLLTVSVGGTMDVMLTYSVSDTSLKNSRRSKIVVLSWNLILKLTCKRDEKGN
jgi:hypothetical protein